MDVLYNVSKQIKAKAVNLADGVGGTELEKKVKAATSNEHYPTPLSQLQEIANATHDYSSCREIMPLVWKRIGESKEYWRIVYKALVLLRELIRFGSERVIDETRDHMFQLRQLENFRYQEDGKERGNGIREVSLEIMDLVHDQRKLQQVREEAQRNRSKYTSQSSSGGGSSYSNSSWQSGSSYDEGPTGKYAGFGGGSDSYSSRGSSSYDEPQKPKKKSSSHDDDNGDDPYGESSLKKSKEEKKKKKSKDRSPSPSPSPNSGDPANGDEEDEKAAKKKKKASKKAKEAAEAALANAPKVTGGKLAPPPAEAPDLFDPRATTTSSSGGDAFTDFQSNTGGDSGFEAFTSAAPAAASKPTNTLDALFDFDGAPPARPAATAAQSVTNNNDFGFGAFNSSSNSSFTQSSKSSSNDWDAFASSTSSTGTRSNTSASSGFDLLSSIPSASPSSSSSRGQQSQQSDVFEAFQTSKPSSSTANSSQPKKSTPSDAWQTDLVKLDLGSSKPTPVQGTQVHIPGPKSADPFSHLIPNQQRPIMPQQSQQPGGMRPGGMGMPMQGGPIMANQIGMGMGMGMGGMQQQQQQGSGMMGMGMGMQGGFGGMPQGGMGMGMQGGMNQAGFGFPQKKPNHDIFF